MSKKIKVPLIRFLRPTSKAASWMIAKPINLTAKEDKKYNLFVNRYYIKDVKVYIKELLEDKKRYREESLTAKPAEVKRIRVLQKIVDKELRRYRRVVKLKIPYVKVLVS